MRYASVFGSMGVILSARVAMQGREVAGVGWVGLAVEAYAAACLLTIAACYGLRHRGRAVEDAMVGGSWSSRLLRAALMPYLILGGLVLRLSRWATREDMMSRVVEGLFIGRRPFRSEVDRLDRAGVDAVLNLCWEFPRPLRALTARVPILDGSPPTEDQFRRAIEAVARWRGEGRTVLVHCAQGHGRSATVLSAILCRLGLAGDAEGALAMIREARPGARPSDSQRRALEAYLAGTGAGFPLRPDVS